MEVSAEFILQKFCFEKDIKKSIIYLLNNICNKYEFDRVCLYIKNKEIDSFEKIYSYERGDNFIDYKNDTNLDDFFDKSKNRNLKDKSFLELFDKRIFYSENFDESYNEFKEVNYSELKDSYISEALAFVIDSNIFCYGIFERYGSDLRLGNDDISTIRAFVEVVKNRIDSEIILKNLITDFKVNDVKETAHRTEREKVFESRMFIALTNDEFVPYLQAKIDLNTNKLCGAEALVRWITPNGMIFPDEFIPFFEKNGFIEILDFTIYKSIIEFISDCLEKGIDICPISLNVSKGHSIDDNFPIKILELVNLYKIPLNLIELEITENTFGENKERLKNFTELLRNYDIKVSVDDFGTAYSSLNILKDVDILKIDKEFLRNINFDKLTLTPTKDEIMFKHIISMAKEMDLSVVCEGVESEEQISLLKKIGCESGQGYLFSKPLSLDNFIKEYY